MPNAVDSLLRDIGQIVWELVITGETAGDTLLDVPRATTKRHRVYGIFTVGTREILELVGTSLDGDAVFVTREQLAMTSQIEHEGIYYEITDERIVEPLHTGRHYAYVLRRHPARRT